MKELDPVGVDTRQGRALRRCLYYGKSPNRVWHLDSYDKLKPLGLRVRDILIEKVDAHYG